MGRLQPREIKDVELAFGGDIKKLMPDYNTLPDKFREWPGDTKWHKVIEQWFYTGLPEGTRAVPKEGIDTSKAIRHISAILGSFEPKHEHKIAGCAYLMSLWFEDVIVPSE